MYSMLLWHMLQLFNYTFGYTRTAIFLFHQCIFQNRAPDSTFAHPYAQIPQNHDKM